VTATGVPLPAVTVIVDRWDEYSFSAAALHAHHPGLGRITVQPTPANTAPASLAQDILYTLGKRLPRSAEQFGTWADSLKPAWDAATAWTLALGIRHVIVTRTNHLTAPRLTLS
jgi:hypothetical protein